MQLALSFLGGKKPSGNPRFGRLSCEDYTRLLGWLGKRQLWQYAFVALSQVGR